MGYKDNFSCFLLQEEKQKKGLAGANPCAIGRTISRLLFYLVIYLRNLPPGNERAAHLSLRTFQYTWSCWSWCRHRHMSPYNVVSSCLAVSPLPPKRRFVFCYGIHKITPICAFHSRVPFPVRTFLFLKFLMVISSSLLVLHILTTERLLRYSSLTFLELPHQKFQKSDRSVLPICQ